MAFCNYSREFNETTFTAVDNAFITHYLPDAPARYVDIYIFGLYLCSRQQDNDVETMSRVLGIDKEDILTAFTYWEELGLVHILQKNPYEVVFLPAREEDAVLKKLNPQKYRQFNKDMQGVFTERLISPNEYNEYYVFLETTYFEPKALVAVAKYCAERKGGDINYPYVLKVARNLADSGIKTAEAVEQKLSSAVKYTEDIKLLFSALKIRRAIDYDDRRLYEKWLVGYGFSPEVIKEVAKKNKIANMQRLDKKLEGYFKMGLVSLPEISDYDAKRESLYDLARDINKIIGVYYESLDFIIEDYVTPWLQKGFDEEALKLTAKYCFKQNVRTIDGMNGVVERFYKNGLTSARAITRHVADSVAKDAKIKELLQTAGLERNVSAQDRASYRTWTEVWGFGEDVIAYVASLAAGANNPMAYINKILADLKSRGIFSVEEAKKQGAKPAQAAYKERQYSEKELDELFSQVSGDVEF